MYRRLGSRLWRMWKTIHTGGLIRILHRFTLHTSEEQDDGCYLCALVGTVTESHSAWLQARGCESNLVVVVKLCQWYHYWSSIWNFRPCFINPVPFRGRWELLLLMLLCPWHRFQVAFSLTYVGRGWGYQQISEFPVVGNRCVLERFSSDALSHALQISNSLRRMLLYVHSGRLKPDQKYQDHPASPVQHRNTPNGNASMKLYNDLFMENSYTVPSGVICIY